MARRSAGSALWVLLLIALVQAQLPATPACAADTTTIDAWNDAYQSPVLTTDTDPVVLEDTSLWHEFKWVNRTYPLLCGYSANKALPTVRLSRPVANGDYYVYANLYGQPATSYRYYYSYEAGDPTAHSVEVGPQLDCAEYQLTPATVTDGEFEIFFRRADVTSGSENYFGWAWVRLVPVDSDPPNVTLTPPGYASSLTTVTITAADATSGVARIEYKVNGGSTVVANGATTIVTFTKPGDNTLEYRAADTMGNYSGWLSATVAVKYSELSLYAPTTCAYGAASIYGYLRCAGPSSAMIPLEDMHVLLERYSAGTWVSVGERVTSPDGRYVFSVVPTSKTAYRARFEGDALYVASADAKRTIVPRVSLTRPTFGRTTLKYGKYYRAYGYLKPHHTNGAYAVKIKAYRYNGREYVYKKTYLAKASDYGTFSKYSDSIKLPSKGRWRLRAYHAADSLNAATYSTYRYVTVK